MGLTWPEPYAGHLSRTGTHVLKMGSAVADACRSTDDPEFEMATGFAFVSVPNPEFGTAKQAADFTHYDCIRSRGKLGARDENVVETGLHK